MVEGLPKLNAEMFFCTGQIGTLQLVDVNRSLQVFFGLRAQFSDLTNIFRFICLFEVCIDLGLKFVHDVLVDVILNNKLFGCQINVMAQNASLIWTKCPAFVNESCCLLVF